MQLAVLQKNPCAKTQGIITPSKQNNELIADTRCSFNKDKNLQTKICLLISYHQTTSEHKTAREIKMEKLVSIHLYYNVYHT